MEENKNITQLSIDDGYELVEIKDKRGELIGQFYFNPTDVGIIDRYNAAVDRFNTVVEPMTSGAMNSDDPDVLMEQLNTAKEKLCETLDYLFASNVSEAFFKRANPFTLINGKFYCENVLEVIGQFIASRLDAEVKHLNERTAKYTHGYAARTGKHKDGKK